MSHTPGPWKYVMTVDQVMSWRPCKEYPRERVESLLAGRDSLTVDEVAALDIPAQDRIWALLHLLDEREQRLFACWCVRYTPLHDGRIVWDLLTDERSRNAVEVSERYADGAATEEELAAARAAAWAAAWDAAGDAAWAAAGAAAWDAARDAAWAAAEDAAGAAQLARLVEIAKAKGEQS